MVKDLRGQWVGPMPVEEIFKLLPISPESLNSKPDFQKTHFAKLKEQKYEKDMYDPFIKSVNAAQVMPGFKLVDTSNHADRKTLHGMKNKPDVSGYRRDVAINTNRTRYEDMELIFEFKTKRIEADPFDDKAFKDVVGEKVKFSFEHNAIKRKSCRGQIACYARVWLSRQHRTHCFIVWIGDPHARIIRFDRSGGIVSAQFNYRTDSHLLLEFLWRFSVTTDEARGLDTTVKLASSNDPNVAIARDKLYEWKPSNGSRRVFEIELPGRAPDKEKTPGEEKAREEKAAKEEAPGKEKILDDPSKPRKVYVWGSLAEPESVTGRATRGYPAWDPIDNRIVFVKDSWRSCQPEMEKESDILQTLNKAGVRNVPTYLYGDDLPGQMTITQDFANEEWNLGAREEHIVKRAHIRFAEDFVGFHLYKFETSKQFVQAVYDAFLAHKDAYELCGILHRDISAGNILMKPDGNGGILNDWDLARTYDKEKNQPASKMNRRQAFRSGTWQFMSAVLLENPSKTHTLQDDIESFFWVILYHTLRYMKHSMSDGLEKNMTDIFDQADNYYEGQPETGGRGKRYLIVFDLPVAFTDFTATDNNPLTDLIETARQMWRQWYTYFQELAQQVTKVMKEQGIPRKEAEKQVPTNNEHLDTNRHEKMASAFASALQQDNWPKGDFSVDHLPRNDKRPIESEEEDDEDSETTDGSESDSGAIRDNGESDGDDSEEEAPVKSRPKHKKQKTGSRDESYRPPRGESSKVRSSNIGQNLAPQMLFSAEGVATRGQTKKLAESAESGL